MKIAFNSIKSYPRFNSALKSAFGGSEAKSYRNDFMEQKIEVLFGRAGVCLLMVLNPDQLPVPMRMDFYVRGEKI